MASRQKHSKTSPEDTARVRIDFEELKPKPTLLLTSRQVAPHVVLFRDLDADAAEQYRLLSHAVEREHIRREAKVFAVTGALEGEGKTVTSINLAFALAEAFPGKILLCDLDLRRAGITQTLGLDTGAGGLTNVLHRRKTLTEVLLRLSTNLTLLPCGEPTERPKSTSCSWG